MNLNTTSDYRPVALTSILYTYMKRVVCSELVAPVADGMKPLQLASKAKARKGGDGWR